MDGKVIKYVKEQHIDLQGKTILVGISGGPDSVALLHLLNTYRHKWHIDLLAVIVNHQLRDKEAEEDVHYVKELCEQWDIPLQIKKIDVQTYQNKNRVSTQVAARELRYRAYAEEMEANQVDFLALGHHGDDQVETVIFQLMRTGDIINFRGIPFTRAFASGHIIRPLLCVTKEEIWSYCSKYHLQPQIDKSNEDEKYTRNFIRKQIVPRLKTYNPNINQTINQLQQSIQIDDHYLQKQAKKALHTCLVEENGRYMINQTVYVSYDLAIQRRMFRMLMNKVYEQIPVELSYTHDKLWHGLLESTDGYQQLDFPQQVIIERAYKTIYVYRKQVGKAAQANEYRIESIPKTIDLEAGHTIDIAYAPVQEEKTHTYFVPEDRLQLPLTIRPRKDGDRMTYRGLQGRKKVKDILIDLKIPRSERDKLLVLEDGKGEIIWLIGWKKRFPRLEKNEQAVRITYDETRSKEEK